MRFAIRQLLNNPGFTAVAVLTLVLGIRAVTTQCSIFTRVGGPEDGFSISVIHECRATSCYTPLAK
jgi:hypothetical protein